MFNVYDGFLGFCDVLEKILRYSVSVSGILFSCDVPSLLHVSSSPGAWLSTRNGFVWCVFLPNITVH